MDFVQIILNDGRYEMRVISSIPDWSANDGEFLCYAAGTARRFYIYVNDVWTYINFTAGGIILLDIIQDTDGDTMIQLEESTDEDIIRFDIGDTQGGSAGERATINNEGFAVTSGLNVALDGRDGNDYLKYNSSSEYIEVYLGGVLRMEL